MLYFTPVYFTAGYFGSVAVHQAGHTLAAYSLGAKSVDVLPATKNNIFHGGFTKYTTSKSFNDKEKNYFNISGPAIQLTANIITREALKTGEIPYILQPTLQWFAIYNKTFVYAESIRGISRNPHADLGKEDIWIPLVFLGTELIYDFYDIYTDDIETFFCVLSGAKFYEKKDKKVGISFNNKDNGSFIGFYIKW